MTRSAGVHYGSSRLRCPLHVPRDGAFHLHRRLHGDVPPVRPRARGAVERDAGAARRGLALRACAQRRRRLPAGDQDADGTRDCREPQEGQGRFAHPCGDAQADRVRVAVLGQSAGSPRRGARLQEVGQADLRLCRIRRRPRVLPGHRRGQDFPDAVDAAGSHRRRDLSVVPARHAGQDRRLRRPPSHRRLQDGGQHLQGKEIHAAAQGDGRGAQPRSLRPDRPRHRRRPEETRRRHPQAVRRRSVPARGRAARRAGGRCGLRRSGGRAAAGGGTTPPSRHRRLRARQPVLARAEQGAAHRDHLRDRHDQQRQERLRPGERPGGRLGDADRIHPPGAPRQLGPRHRPARRQPRRFGHGVRRDLARADPHQEREERSAADRLDVGSGGLGRLLHRDAGLR